MIRAVVLDLDDTLYAERDYVRSGFTAVGEHIAQLGVCPPGAFASAAWARFELGHRTRVFDETLAGLGIAPPAGGVAGLVELYRGHRPTIRLFPDAASYLDGTRAGRRLGIITDGYRMAQRQKVEALDLARRVAAVVYSDDFGPDCWKPHPKPYLEMQERLGLPGGELVYVGDNPKKDFVGARAVGWKTVRMRRPGTLHAELEPEAGFGADAELGSFGELHAVLRAWE